MLRFMTAASPLRLPVARPEQLFHAHIGESADEKQQPHRQEGEHPVKRRQPGEVEKNRLGRHHAEECEPGHPQRLFPITDAAGQQRQRIDRPKHREPARRELRQIQIQRPVKLGAAVNEPDRPGEAAEQRGHAPPGVTVPQHEGDNRRTGAEDQESGQPEPGQRRVVRIPGGQGEAREVAAGSDHHHGHDAAYGGGGAEPVLPKQECERAEVEHGAEQQPQRRNHVRKLPDLDPAEQEDGDGRPPEKEAGEGRALPFSEHGRFVRRHRLRRRAAGAPPHDETAGDERERKSAERNKAVGQAGQIGDICVAFPEQRCRVAPRHHIEDRRQQLQEAAAGTDSEIEHQRCLNRPCRRDPASGEKQRHGQRDRERREGQQTQIQIAVTHPATHTDQEFGREDERRENRDARLVTHPRERLLRRPDRNPQETCRVDRQQQGFKKRDLQAVQQRVEQRQHAEEDEEPAAEADDGPPVGGELRIVEFPDRSAEERAVRSKCDEIQQSPVAVEGEE